MITFRNARTGQPVFKESDDGKLEILDPDLKEQWDAQERIEDSVRESSTVTESTNNILKVPAGNMIEALASHEKLHKWHKEGAPEGWTQESIEQEHSRLTRTVLARGWKHYSREGNTLDTTLAGDLAKRTSKVIEAEVVTLTNSHGKLHAAYSNTKAEKLESLHTQIVTKMLEMSIGHNVSDALDETLPTNLKEWG